MVMSFAVRSDRSEGLRKAYEETLDRMDLEALVREFLSYLDYTEETDSGREFHPICISSVRVLMSQPLGMCLTKLRETVE
jgi:hypothetical protein